MRIFVGIAVPAEIQENLRDLYDGLRALECGLKTVTPGNLHITLRFLGETGERETASFAEACAMAAGDIRPFEVTVAGFGCFPDARSPRTLWVDTATPPALVALHMKIESCVRALGLPPERKFVGHVTVARVKGRIDHAAFTGVLERHRTTRWGTMDVAEYTVFQSVLGPDGPAYHPLRTITLGGTAHG
jgi:RNA 2',3'-cyclic 3'-phosphodiesterase